MAFEKPPINEGWDLTMDPSSSLVNRFKLETQLLPNHTLHTSSRSDPARGSEKEIVTTSWSRIKEIGVGNCGSVWLESDLNGSERAVKRIPKWIYTRNKIDYKREVAAMAVLSKFEQNFVQFYGWYESLKDIYLAMEYFPLGDLERYMDRQLSKFQIKVIILQLLQGLCIMHQNKFTHRDLKPKNIFVVKDSPYFWVKIGDFGITKRVPHDGTSLKTETGTLGYVAPEVLGYHDQESSKYTNAVDLWSLGCICHRLLTMQAPFENPATMIRYCSGVTKLPIETLRRDDDEAVAFVKRLLMVSPSERYTAERALQSLWLDSLRSQEPLHVAQHQSQSQDDLPWRDNARKYTRADGIIAIFIAIVMGWWAQFQLFGRDIIGNSLSYLITTILFLAVVVLAVIGHYSSLALFTQFCTSSGVWAVNAQVLVFRRKLFILMYIIIVVIPTVWLVGLAYQYR